MKDVWSQLRQDKDKESEKARLRPTPACASHCWCSYRVGLWRGHQGATSIRFHFVDPMTGEGTDIKACVKNKEVILPFLSRMAPLESRPLPGIDGLREEITACYAVNKRGTSNGEDIDKIASTSWRIKFLVGFVKMKARRSEVSTATWLW